MGSLGNATFEQPRNHSRLLVAKPVARGLLRPRLVAQLPAAGTSQLRVGERGKLLATSLWWQTLVACTRTGALADTGKALEVKCKRCHQPMRLARALEQGDLTVYFTYCDCKRKHDHLFAVVAEKDHFIAPRRDGGAHNLYQVTLLNADGSFVTLPKKCLNPLTVKFNNKYLAYWQEESAICVYEWENLGNGRITPHMVNLTELYNQSNIEDFEIERNNLIILWSDGTLICSQSRAELDCNDGFDNYHLRSWSAIKQLRPDSWVVAGHNETTSWDKGSQILRLLSPKGGFYSELTFPLAHGDDSKIMRFTLAARQSCLIGLSELQFAHVFLVKGRRLASLGLNIKVAGPNSTCFEAKLSRMHDEAYLVHHEGVAVLRLL